MAKLSILAGATSVTVNLFIADSSSTTGAGLTGLAYNTASLVAYYALPAAAAVAITLATQTVTGAFSSGGFVEISSANMPGWYRFDIPNAAIASGRFSSIHFKGATNMAPLPLEIELTAVNNQSAATFMTGVNGLAPPTNWNSMSIDGSGRVDVIKIAGTTQTARDVGASVLLSTGTGTGQLDFTSGVVKANATQWLSGTIPAVNVTGVPLVDAKYLLGTIFSTPTVAGIPNVNAKTWNDLATVALPLIPTTAGRTLDVSAGGEAGLDWANVGSPTTSLALTGTTIATTQKVDIETIKTQAVTAASGVTILASVGTAATSTAQTGDNYARLGAPAGASVSADIAAAKVDTAAIKAKTDNLPAAPASTTNITAGTITTVTNLTNAPTAGDLTATMKTSVTTAATASLATTTYAEPAQGAPGATVSLADKISFLYKAWRNKSTQSATTYSLFNDDAATVDHKATVSDSGTVFTRSETTSGP